MNVVVKRGKGRTCSDRDPSERSSLNPWSRSRDRNYRFMMTMRL